MVRFFLPVTALAGIMLVGLGDCSTANVNPNSKCACGYTVNATTSTTYAIFTELLETDFTHLSDIRSNDCWVPQQYNQTASKARGKYGKAATLQNVISNPYASTTQWAGHGINGGDAGLQLWVNNTVVDGMVTMGEIASQRMDMLYGSFRVGMKVTGTPGTCGGFFYYHNDSQEIDMEFLSSNFTGSSNPVFLIMQTPDSVAAGYNAAGTGTYKVQELPFVPYNAFHEYRFDWTPEKASFYADSQWLQDLYFSYPQTSGHVSLNHWSNGNTAWSQGPPVANAVVTISYIKAYFNSTDSALRANYEAKCAVPAVASEKCTIPNQMVPGQNGYGQTQFFNRGMCGEDIGAATTTTAMIPGAATATDNAVSTTLSSGASLTLPTWVHGAYTLCTAMSFSGFSLDIHYDLYHQPYNLHIVLTTVIKVLKCVILLGLQAIASQFLCFISKNTGYFSHHWARMTIALVMLGIMCHIYSQPVDTQLILFYLGEKLVFIMFDFVVVALQYSVTVHGKEVNAVDSHLWQWFWHCYTGCT